MPVTPLSEVLGSVGTLAPAHIVSDVPKEKPGVVLGVTVTVNVTGIEHTPAAGVKL